MFQSVAKLIFLLMTHFFSNLADGNLMLFRGFGLNSKEHNEQLALPMLYWTSNTRSRCVNYGTNGNHGSWVREQGDGFAEDDAPRWFWSLYLMTSKLMGYEHWKCLVEVKFRQWEEMSWVRPERMVGSFCRFIPSSAFLSVCEEIIFFAWAWLLLPVQA